jgi:hypothetical protein
VAIVAVVSVTVGFVLGLGIPLTLKALAQPRINLADQLGTNTACSYVSGAPTPPQFYLMSYSVHNSGDVDGFATVAIFIDASQVAITRYYVPAHEGLADSKLVSVNDCAAHGWDIRTMSVEKA